MARFFVSYSRKKRDEVHNIIELLIASEHEVWWDGDIPVIADWWSTILEKIEWCEVFIFVESEGSVQSSYCVAELKYANDRQKPILHFVLEDVPQDKRPTDLPSRGQYLRYDGNPTNLLSEINRAYSEIRWELHTDIDAPRPPEPQTGDESIASQYQKARRLSNEMKFDEAKAIFQNVKRLDYGEWGKDCDEWLARLNAYAELVILFKDESTLPRAQRKWRAYIRNYGQQFDPAGLASNIGEETGEEWIQQETDNIETQESSSQPPIESHESTHTIVVEDNNQFAEVSEKNIDSQRWGSIIGVIGITVALIGLTTSILLPELRVFLGLDTPQPTPIANLTLNDTPIPTDTTSPTPSDTPTLPPTLEIAFVVQTLDAEATVEQATMNVEVTAIVQATANAVGTQSIFDQTAIATLWTDTPTPDITASIDAYRTQQVKTATQAWIDSWTDTPTATNTPTSTLTPTLSPESIAQIPVTDNADWTPYERDFDGVTMMLVPVGCFNIYYKSDTNDEVNIDQICFEAPFWIDKFEVTNEDYGPLELLDCESTSTQANQPRNCVSWFEARDFCIARDGRLPTEIEWEYVAGGPDELIYPWGNEFIPENVSYAGNSTALTIVGSHPNGVSWAGAMDLSGNIREWTSSLSRSYPYDKLDGRENLDNLTENRVTRGGSFGSARNFLTTSFRFGVNPSTKHPNYGFRCARDFEG